MASAPRGFAPWLVEPDGVSLSGLLHELIFRVVVHAYARLARRGWVVAVYRGGGLQLAPFRTIALYPVADEEAARALALEFHAAIEQGFCDDALPLSWKAKRERLGSP